MDKIEIGNKISELRKKQNLTQKQLAKKLYVTDKAVSKWERGINLPDFALIEPLAKELNVNVIELLGLNNKNNEEIIREVNEFHIEKDKSRINVLKKTCFYIIMILFSIWLLNEFVNFGNYKYVLNNNLSDIEMLVYEIIINHSTHLLFVTLVCNVIFTILQFNKILNPLITINISLFSIYAVMESFGISSRVNEWSVYYASNELRELLLNNIHQEWFVLIGLFIILCSQIGLIFVKKKKCKYNA